MALHDLANPETILPSQIALDTSFLGVARFAERMRLVGQRQYLPSAD